MDGISPDTGVLRFGENGDAGAGRRGGLARLGLPAGSVRYEKIVGLTPPSQRRTDNCASGDNGEKGQDVVERSRADESKCDNDYGKGIRWPEQAVPDSRRAARKTFTPTVLPHRNQWSTQVTRVLRRNCRQHRRRVQQHRGAELRRAELFGPPRRFHRGNARCQNTGVLVTATCPKLFVPGLLPHGPEPRNTPKIPFSLPLAWRLRVLPPWGISNTVVSGDAFQESGLSIASGGFTNDDDQLIN